MTTPRPRTMKVIDTGGIGCFARGREAADVITTVTGRRPTHTATGWAFQAKHLADVVAAAERRGFTVRVLVEGEVGQ